jgi:putative transposase
VVKAFKGRSSSLLRRKFPELLKLPSLWTNSYFGVAYLRDELGSEIIEKSLKIWVNHPRDQQRRYFYSTAGQVSADVIKRYIEDPHHG